MYVCVCARVSRVRTLFFIDENFLIFQGTVPWLDLAEALSTYTGCKGDVVSVIMKGAFRHCSSEFLSGGCRIFDMRGRVSHGYSTGIRASKDVDAKLFEHLLDSLELGGPKGGRRLRIEHVYDMATHYDDSKTQSYPGFCKPVRSMKALVAFSALFECFQLRDEDGKPYLDEKWLREILVYSKFPTDFNPHRWGVADFAEEFCTAQCGCNACYECLNRQAGKTNEFRLEERKSLLQKRKDLEGGEASSYDSLDR